MHDALETSPGPGLGGPMVGSESDFLSQACHWVSVRPLGPIHPPHLPPPGKTWIHRSEVYLSPPDSCKRSDGVGGGGARSAGPWVS